MTSLDRPPLAHRGLPARVLACTACAVVLVACGDDPASERVAVAPRPTTVAAAGPAADTARPLVAGGGDGVLVDVAGHVRRPGVYRIRVGGRVHEAIEAAGGARAGADLTTINRAAALTDGQQVLVAGPARVGEPGPSGPSGATQVSINAASVEELDALPGIGPVTAGRIVEERTSGGPFASIDDLDRVSGVGPATIEALRSVART